MKNITQFIGIVCLSVFICSCLDVMILSIRLQDESYQRDKRKEAVIANKIATEYPTGDYTGKYIMGSDRGERWILIKHYKNGLILYSLDVDDINGKRSNSYGILKLVGDVNTAVSEESYDHTKIIFNEGLNKQGNKTIIVELFYQDKTLGTFIKTESKATELGKDD